MRIFLMAVVYAVLTGCTTATTQKYDVMLDHWLNKDEVALVSSWGAPDTVYQVEGKKFLSYYSQYNQYIPRTPYRYQPYFSGGWSYYDPIDNAGYQVIPQLCKTTFTVESEKIVSWIHQGDGCKAE